MEVCAASSCPGVCCEAQSGGVTCRPPRPQAIPDIGDYTIKKVKRIESFVPVPDTLLDRAAKEKESMKSIDVSGTGMATPMGGTNSTVSELSGVSVVGRTSPGCDTAVFGWCVATTCSHRCPKATKLHCTAANTHHH